MNFFIGWMGGAVLMMTGPIWVPLAWRWLKERAPQKDTPATLTVTLVISILDGRPESWKFDNYRLENKPAGVSMWLANGRDSLSLRIDGLTADPYRDGTGVDLSARHRRDLWDAIQRFHGWRLQQQAEGFARRASAEFRSPDA